LEFLFSLVMAGFLLLLAILSSFGIASYTRQGNNAVSVTSNESSSDFDTDVISTHELNAGKSNLPEHTVLNPSTFKNQNLNPDAFASDASPVPANQSRTTNVSHSSLIISPASITSVPLLSPLTCENNRTARSQTNAHNGTFSWLYESYESVTCCDNLHGQWSELSSNYADPYDIFTRWSTVGSTTFPQPITRAVCDGPFTTLCDGIPRALCSPSVPQRVIISATYTSFFSSQTGTKPSLPFSIAPPQCTIAQKDCARLWGEFLDWKNAGRMDSGYLDAGPDPNGAPYYPYCSRSSYDSCPECYFGESSVKLIYWAVGADETDLCPVDKRPKSKRTTTKLNQVGTALWGSFTLTSPTVYAYFSTLRHDLGCGSVHTDIMLPILSMDVSTLADEVFAKRSLTSASSGYNQASKLDFKRLAFKTIGSLSYPLVPHSAYIHDGKALSCPGLGNECKTIYHDYQPAIFFRVHPEALRSIDPEWKYCSNQQFGAWDPPIALTVATELPKVVLPKMSFFFTKTTAIDPLGAEALATQVVENFGPRPGATEVRPYAMQTSAAQQIREGWSSNERPNGGPGVIVSKVSLYTVFASSVGGGHDSSSKKTVVGNLQGDNQYNSPDNGEPARVGQLNGNPSPLGISIPSQGAISTGRNQKQSEAIFTHSSRTYTAKQLSPGTFVLQGSTFSNGGSPITIHGAVISAFGEGVVVQNSAGSEVSGASSTMRGGSEMGDDVDKVGGTVDGGGEEVFGSVPTTKGKGKKSGAIRSTNSPELLQLIGMVLWGTIIMYIFA
jgi:hypothetical protein